MSFNVSEEEDGEALVNDRSRRQKCSRCSRNSNTVKNSTTKYRYNGTRLHNMGEIKEMDYKINNEVGTEMTTKHEDHRCHGNALIFINPDVSSLMDWSNTSARIA